MIPARLSVPKKPRNPRKTAAISNLKVQIASFAAGLPKNHQQKIGENFAAKKNSIFAFPKLLPFGTPISTYSKPMHSVQAFSDSCLQLQRVDINGPELESTMGEAT